MSLTRSITLFVLLLCGLAATPTFAASTHSIHVSNNWSGYAASGDIYTGVSASWTVPVSTGTDKNISADAAWVGIGGVTQDDLIQAGTQAIVRTDQTTYTAWYELLPDTQQTVPLAIHPGDQMSVSIREVRSGYWLVTISDVTTGQTYQNTFAYSSSHSSAEWIVERPLAMTGKATGYLPLSDFTDVPFTNAQILTQNGTAVSLADAGAEPLIMSGSSSRLIAAPTDLQGNSFNVTYLNSAQSAHYLHTLRRTYKQRYR